MPNRKLLNMRRAVRAFRQLQGKDKNCRAMESLSLNSKIACGGDDREQKARGRQGEDQNGIILLWKPTRRLCGWSV